MEHLLHRTANESTYYVPPPGISLLCTTTNNYCSGQLFFSVWPPLDHKNLLVVSELSVVEHLSPCCATICWSSFYKQASKVVTMVHAEEALPVVTILSSLAVSSANKPGYYVGLSCFSCKEYGSCGQQQVGPVRITIPAPPHKLDLPTFNESIVIDKGGFAASFFEMQGHGRHGQLECAIRLYVHSAVVQTQKHKVPCTSPVGGGRMSGGGEGGSAALPMRNTL